MKRIKRAALGLVAMISLLASCAGVNFDDPYNDRGKLRETQREFNQYLRWGLIDKAAQFVVAEQRPEFEALAPHLSDLRISHYEVVRVEQKSEIEAEVIVRYEGYSLSSPIEKQIVLDQTWTREDDSAVWLVSLEVGRLRNALGLAAR